MALEDEEEDLGRGRVRVLLLAWNFGIWFGMVLCRIFVGYIFLVGVLRF